jgi:hypothetical protein
VPPRQRSDRRPNPRLQRTPSAPLSRQPLGHPHFLPRRFDTFTLVIMRRLLALLVLCLQAQSLVGEPFATDQAFLERLGGSWILRGTLAGKVATHDVTATWILDGLYLELHERSRESDAKGKPQYEAVILLGVDPATGEYQCLWLDSTGGGGLSPTAFGRGKRSGDSIPFLFRDADGTISFSNTFLYDTDAKAWTWQLDNVRKDGTHTPFGRVRLTRQ